jgi:glutamate dehydrogenase
MGQATLQRRLVEAVAEALAASQLPGDVPLAPKALREAARFVLATAHEHQHGSGEVAIETVPGPVGERLMRIAAVNPDMPFLVDSLAAAIGAHGLSIDRLLHPVLAVERNRAGRLTGIGAGAERESMIYVETPRADARTRVRLRGALETVLADVHAAVSDWPAMREIMARDATLLTGHDGGDLLGWLNSGMLTLLGSVERRRDGGQRQPLGICRKSARALLAPESYDRAFAWFDRHGARAARAAPLIVKANLLSNVHRRVPLDLFIVPLIEDGAVAALSVHAGVWTSAALAAPPFQVPRLRDRLAAMTARLGFDPLGHNGKALAHALTALPRDLLIGFAPRDLERTALAMVALIDRPRPRLVLVRDPLGRHLYAFVWLPRDAVSTALRQQIQAMLETASAARTLDWGLEVEGGALALLRFVLDMRASRARPDEAALDLRLQEMVRGWQAAVEAELAGAQGGDAGRAAAIAARYAEAFPPTYRSAYSPREAAADIQRLRALAVPSGSEAVRRGARLHRAVDDDAGELRLKLYQNSGALALSDAVPALENFGFRVIEDVPTALAGGRLGTIHDFQLAPPAGADTATLLDRAREIEDAIACVLNGEDENDAFNRLIVANGLARQEVDWLRGWYRYLRQTGMNFGVPTAVDALQNAPRVTRGLLDLFGARHDPAFTGDRQRAEARARTAIREGLAGVAAINDDRLLRRYGALVEAVLRTNAFVPAGRAALAFKLDPALIPGLPRPLPWREIFVFSAQVEGIHLRAGPVARGGLRWSDRRDDFRTEVLGLMKAQRVKNAVIVPTGAKGGFYPKRLPDPAANRDAWLAEGKASYQTFVRALLSLTDNIVGGKVVHPRGMMICDGEDPYFVVAADKGTATYSDTANAIAAEHGFWLDDAFASGGSKGYDHKAMGITARGAWISVQRHFREIGIDVQNEPIRVAGCGDMSGDVFGNGMLLSQTIKLVAAFDHRHIFLDPDPDPAASWAERRRLFALPRSSWDDYDKALISPGGGVYPRSQKTIALSEQARAALGIGAASLDPENLISAILKSPVDLLWFGGIGTYVKAAAENNVDVGDPANDALRIDGRDIRALAVGEGANLGCTQAGRIEFALTGGRINTDFIDNSAGVDCSDKEVNIKIALAAAMRESTLSEAARVKLLAAMTDDVAALVLEDNRLQALALSIAQSGGATANASYLRLIDMLEEHGQLDRRSDGIADAETLLRRGSEGKGLTRPELAVLLSSSKLALQDAIEASALPDDPDMTRELAAAFPAAMRKRFRPEIEAHRLRREILATRIANRIVNRMGMLHPFELVEEEGASLAQVAAAFVAAERLFGLDPLWAAIEEADMTEGARILLLRRASSALRSHMADLLRAGAGLVQPAQLVAELAEGVALLERRLGSLLGGEALVQSQRLHADLIEAGAPEPLAVRVARLSDLDGAVGIARLARDLSLDPLALTRAFGDIGARLGLDWVQTTASLIRPPDPWERLLTAGLARDFQQVRLDFLRRLGSTDPLAAVSAWAERHALAVRQFRAMVARAQVAVPVTPAMLARIAGQARNLLAR